MTVDGMKTACGNKRAASPPPPSETLVHQHQHRRRRRRTLSTSSVASQGCVPRSALLTPRATPSRSTASTPGTLRTPPLRPRRRSVSTLATALPLALEDKEKDRTERDNTEGDEEDDGDDEEAGANDDALSIISGDVGSPRDSVLDFLSFSSADGSTFSLFTPSPATSKAMNAVRLSAEASGTLVVQTPRPKQTQQSGDTNTLT
ncbi:hypothetical protein PINS_up004649 [Pythium insidiosum]|nr:hypothetical protein PINS_up004649 [Pythium insidiosum]